ncbi:MAG: hypothetical protein Q7T87_00450 [Polaromonas sp.]|nr:hypothetical protein [Polaromonas sp.]
MIYLKTELGQSAFQTRSNALTPRQRSAFILFDGKRSENDVLQATSGLGVTAADVDQMVSQGLLAPQMPSPGASDLVSRPAPLEPPRASGAPTFSDQASYSRAYPIATRLTAALGLRGFRLNLAVEAAGDLEKLRELAPKIREAVGPEKFSELDAALYD